MKLPSGQWNCSANSGRLRKGPFTLKEKETNTNICDLPYGHYYVNISVPLNIYSRPDFKRF